MEPCFCINGRKINLWKRSSIQEENEKPLQKKNKEQSNFCIRKEESVLSTTTSRKKAVVKKSNKKEYQAVSQF